MPTGRLTRDDLLRAWRDAVDPDFARGVLEGGEGAEVPGQLCEQLALVSAAAEEASEELRLLPYSGQTAAPASGARRSTVLLDVARTSGFAQVLALEPGQLFEEVAVDATPGGALLALLLRYRSSGLVTGDGSVVEPAGDVLPAPGQTIRVRFEDVTVEG